MCPTAAFPSAGPRGHSAAAPTRRPPRAALAALILPVALAFAWPAPADAAPRKARPHAAAKPVAKKSAPAAQARQRRTPAKPVAQKGPRRAEAPGPAVAAAMPTPLPARADPARPRRPAATVKDPGTREDIRAARMACERDGRILFLEDCMRPEPPPLRASQALAEAR